MAQSKTFVIGDIHGRYDLLVVALHTVQKTAESGDTLVFLGDYVDRGPDSSKVVQQLIDLSDVPALLGPHLNIVCLRGNHEDMMYETICMPLNENWWIANGGNTTLLSYGHDRSFVDYDPRCVDAEHLDWINSLPYFHEDQHRVYVHAGIPSRWENRELKDVPPDTIAWFGYSDGADYGYHGKHVVHGHTPYVNGPILLTHRTNLDVGAYSTGRMAIGVFDDDKPGGPVEVLWAEVLQD